jgi:hypothetical protein
METYNELKTRHHDELNEFSGMFFAFNNEQFTEGMKRIDLDPSDTKSILSIGAGGYIRKDKAEALRELFKRHTSEREGLKKDEKLLIDAIAYELSNHEYCYTYDTQPALDALGYTKEEIGPAVLNKAIKKALSAVSL